jgi:hypothetical protein
VNEQNTAVTFEDISPVKKKLNFAIPGRDEGGLDEVSGRSEKRPR